MKKTEIILVLLAIIGLLFKVRFLPGGGMFISIALLSLALLYMVFGFAFFNKIPLKKIFKSNSYTADTSEKTGFRILISILLGFGLAFALLGLLCVFQFWGCGFIFLTNGLVFLFLVLIISLIRYSKTKSKFYARIFIRLIIIGGMALFFRLMPNTTWLEIQYCHYPEYVEAVKNWWKDPDNKELEMKVDEIRKKRYEYEYYEEQIRDK